MIVRYLQMLGILILMMITGYFMFLLYLLITGNLNLWKQHIKKKYGVGIWDFSGN